MSIQDILRILGVVLLVAAAVLAVAAAYTYRALDIRGVKDDLAGRRREAPSANAAKSRGHRRVGEKADAGPVQATPSTDDSKRRPLSPGQPPSPVRSPLPAAPPNHPMTPAVKFRVTHKEIVATSEKTIEE